MRDSCGIKAEHRDSQSAEGRNRTRPYKDKTRLRSPTNRPPTTAPRPPLCLHSPVQHEINIERSIAGRVPVATVAHARVEVEEEEEEDFRTHPDPNHGPPVSCQQPRRDTVIPSRGFDSHVVQMARLVCSLAAAAAAAAAQHHRTSGCARQSKCIHRCRIWRNEWRHHVLSMLLMRTRMRYWLCIKSYLLIYYNIHFLNEIIQSKNK